MKPNITPVTFTIYSNYFNDLGLSQCHYDLTRVYRQVVQKVGEETLWNENSESIYKLWDELSDFGVGAIDDALNHCLSRLCQWLDADNAFWIGAVRVMQGKQAHKDAMLGWRASSLQLLDSEKIDRARQKESIRRLNAVDPGDTTRALVVQAGCFRAYRLRASELVDFTSFQKTDHYDYYYREIGISDRLWIVFPVGDDTECYYCFDKYGVHRRFSQSGMELAAGVMRGIKWFHRQILLSHGIGIAGAPLTPSERRTLQSLVTGASRKEIACQLGVTPGTAHQYCLSVYRKFGVSSKAGLLALWLNHPN